MHTHEQFKGFLATLQATHLDDLERIVKYAVHNSGRESYHARQFFVRFDIYLRREAHKVTE